MPEHHYNFNGTVYCSPRPQDVVLQDLMEFLLVYFRIFWRYGLVCLDVKVGRGVLRVY